MRRLSSIALVALCIAGFGVSPASARRRTTASPSPAPTPSPTATPLPEAERLARLHARLHAIVDEAPGELGIAIVDPYRGTRFAINGDRLFPLASVFKVTVAVAAYRLADQRKLDLTERVTVGRADFHSGYSPIAVAHPSGDVTFAYWELIRAMLVESDNTACDVILRAVGGPSAVAALLERMHLPGFVIRKSEADMAADVRANRSFARGGDNGGTPYALAGLFEAIASQRALLLDATNEILTDLSHAATGGARLRAGIPPEIPLAHKTGTGETFGGATDATNDAGVITFPDGRRIVVVALLGASSADAATRDATIASVGRAVYDAYAP